MTAKSIVSTAAGVLLAFAIAGVAADTPDVQRAPLQQFKASIQQYVQLHRRIERQLPPLRARSDAHEIVESSNAMASALQTLLDAAHEGSIFTPTVGVLLRSRIAEALDARGFAAEQVIAARQPLGPSAKKASADEAEVFTSKRFKWPEPTLTQ